MSQNRDWRSEYRNRLRSADDVVSHLESGQRLVLPTLAGQPPALLAAMGRAIRNSSLPNVRAGTILPGPSLAKALLQPEHAHMIYWDSLFCGASDRPGVFEGRYDMTPMHFGQMPKIMRDDMNVDAVMPLASPPADQGGMSIGI